MQENSASKVMSIYWNIILTIAVLPGFAFPQTNEHWRDVERLKPGTRIDVIHGNLARTSGAIDHVTAEGITLRLASGDSFIARAAVKRVSTVSMTRKRRALIGTAVGGGAMAIVSLIAARSGDYDLRHDYVVGAATVLGAGIGAGVGALTGGPRTIYRAP